jgi:hypothetical protein
MKTTNALTYTVAMMVAPGQCSMAILLEQVKFECMEKDLFIGKWFAFFLLLWQILFPGQP